VLSASQALNNQLQRDLDSPASVADIDIVSPVTITLDQARAQAVAISPDVRAAQDNVDSAKAALAASRLSREPDLALQASDARSKDVTGFSRLDTVQISLTMPLSDGGLAREQVAEAQAALDSAQTALLQARQSAELAAGEAYLTAQGALAQVGPTQTAADIAQTTLEKTQEGYLAGLNPIYDVLNAQVALNAAKIAHAQALYDAASAVAALNRSLGKVMP
jgi:outer membrane protein TolC